MVLLGYSCFFFHAEWHLLPDFRGRPNRFGDEESVTSFSSGTVDESQTQRVGSVGYLFLFTRNSSFEYPI